MDDDARTVLLAAWGAAFGALVAFVIGTPAELILFVASACCALGVVAAIAISAGESRRRKTRTKARRRRPAHSRPEDRQIGETHRRVHPKPEIPAPVPFRKRLAQFTHQEEADVMQETDTFQSKMPFWSAVDFLLHVPPKSARAIRVCLLAIRRAVRRSDVGKVHRKS